MAKTYKILGQAMPTNNTNVDLYTVPAGNSAVISTLNICNTSLSNVTFRVLAKIAGVTSCVATSQAIVWDAALPAQDAIGLTLGMTLGATDKITVYSWQGNVAFTMFGTEIY
jgi:hypothetical protein